MHATLKIESQNDAFSLYNCPEENNDILKRFKGLNDQQLKLIKEKKSQKQCKECTK